MSGDDRATLTNRARAVLLALLLVPVGLATKQSSVGWVADHLGGAVYVMFFCFVVFAGRPTASRLAVVAGVTLATCLIECLQLSSADWLEAIRATRPGGMLLGASFSWADFPFYALGGAAAWVIDAVVPRPRS
ncbi:MAG: DUF2809 domain-containing protein [Planctomycetota bacterium]|nr:DUF2809 domain-containing protein [Planctomycetota bacterium]